MKQSKLMNILKHVARILIGVTFIFSGFVKGIDPWGSSYKFTDYFHAMGLDWMVPLAFLCGILLAFSEYIIGVTHLFAIKLKFFSWASLLYMLFFTPVTLWIALKNPVTDCGCFGDALVISNWGTFYKNIVLLIMAIIVVICRKQIICFAGVKTGNVLAGGAVLVYIIAAGYSWLHEPIFDFRPFKVGVNIQQGMTTPADAPKDVFENTFYYKNKKTGEIKKFTEKNYPWQDTLNWEFSKMDESVLVSKGYTPPIHGFTIETRGGDNVYDFFLNYDNYVFMLIAYNLDKSSLKSQGKINELAKWAKDQKYQFICLTSSVFEKSDQFGIKYETPYEFFNCDEIALKTIIRSNPGLIILKKGTIIAKYHYNDIPTPEKYSRKFLK
jgi:uncharacterized membrane protein YphA (DoxX/SURF4 family)